MIAEGTSGVKSDDWYNGDFQNLNFRFIRLKWAAPNTYSQPFERFALIFEGAHQYISMNTISLLDKNKANLKIPRV